MQVPTVICPQCSREFPEHYRYCPDCGLPRTAVRLELERLSGATGVPVSDLIAIEQRGDNLPPFPLEWRRAKLDATIRSLNNLGYINISRSDVSAQVQKKKQFSGLWAFVWFVLTFGFGLILYVLYYLSLSEPTLFLEVDSKNHLHVTGPVDSNVYNLIVRMNAG